ncbi:hypothetical protein CR513_04241, partial [Mucuna pruriens]
MGDEATEERERSFAAPLIFLIVAAFQFAYYCLDRQKKNKSENDKEIQMRTEIKQLLKKAGSMSQPSTFVQAAKLKRQATAKERELSKLTKQGHLNFSAQILSAKRYLTYGALIIWFWRVPVASISHQLVQPFECLLSWKGREIENNSVMEEGV